VLCWQLGVDLRVVAADRKSAVMLLLTTINQIVPVNWDSTGSTLMLLLTTRNQPVCLLLVCRSKTQAVAENWETTLMLFMSTTNQL
jgi:hypothetical protein